MELIASVGRVTVTQPPATCGAEGRNPPSAESSRRRRSRRSRRRRRRRRRRKRSRRRRSRRSRRSLNKDFLENHLEKRKKIENVFRSEERRVGKECRCRWSAGD